MKITIDLPCELVRRLKLRANQTGRKLKEVAADILDTGLTMQGEEPADAPPVVVKDKKTGLPVIQCRRSAPRGQEMAPQRAAEILTAQEAEWTRGSRR